MPASTKDTNGPSPTLTPSGPLTPLGRNSRTSTRRSTPVGTSGAPTILTVQQLNPPDLNGEAGDMSNWMIYQPAQVKPSYKEYDDNATPSLSTQQMQPLGEMPPARAIDATKRPFAYQTKKKGKGKQTNGNGVSAGGVGRPGQAGKAKTTTPTATVSPDASARTSDSPSGFITLRPAPPNPWFNGNAPSSKTPQGRQRLSMVVEAAVHRSKITGNVDMGRAIKKLYDESLTDHSLADLLDAVLAQRSTPQQFQQFQNYVRTARANPEALDSERPFSTITQAGQEERGSEPGGEEQMEVKTEMEPTQVFNGTSEENGEKKIWKPRRKSGAQSEWSDAEESELDMASGMADSFKEPAEQSNSASPEPSAELENLPKGMRVPSYEELKRDSHIRDPPRPAPPTRTRGKKRARSPSPSRSMGSPPAERTLSAATQTPTLAQHPKKKNKTNKIKVSPVKKAATLDNTVVTAGIGEEASDHRRARYGSEEVSENEDVCAVCNGSGRFLCCERCPRSFHFSCLNPPLEDVPEGMWFCNKCQAQTNPPPKEPKGLFCELFDNIKRQNPTSFRLPITVRDYFSGVETGLLGEYVDTRDAKTQKFSKSGFPEEYDTHKLKDKQGNPLLCHDCGKSAIDGQQIISCDYCPLSWHLDCIRPMPMSNPPSGRRKWMCPAHADWVLQRRRPKNAPVVDTFLRRGHKNDGLIEIENEEDDQMEFEEITMSGVVYRLPERGIKLDFLDKVKVMNERENSRKRVSEVQIVSEESPKRLRVSEELPQKIVTVTQGPGEMTPENITPIDRQLVSALIELKSHERVGVQPATVALIQDLLKEAGGATISLLSRANTSASIEHEKEQLMALRDLISSRLLEIAPTITPTPPTEPSDVELVEPRPVENGHSKIDEFHLLHQTDHEFDQLLDADMDADGDYEIDEDPIMSLSTAVIAPIDPIMSLSAIPMAPMAPMISVPVAPIAPMAPMAFMKPPTPANN